MKILHCPKCGAEIKNYYIYCGVCGEPLKPVSDKDEKLFRITAEIKDGDMSHFDEFYTLTYPLIKGVFSKGNYKDFTEEDREDLIQETYTVVYQKIDALQDVRSVRGWMTTVATSIALNQISRQGAKKRQAEIVNLEPDEDFDEDPLDNIADDEAESIESLIENKEVQGFIKEALDSLPEEQRTVLLAVYMGGMKQAEVAATLGLNENTVKTRISRGKKKLQVELEKIEKKQNIKLHSFAPIPLLYIYFHSQLANTRVSAAEVQSSFKGVTEAISKAAPHISAGDMKISPQPLKGSVSTQAGKVLETFKANVVKEGAQASQSAVSTASIGSEGSAISTATNGITPSAASEVVTTSAKQGIGTKLASAIASHPIKTLAVIGVATAAVSFAGYSVTTPQDNSKIVETANENASPSVSQSQNGNIDIPENKEYASTNDIETVEEEGTDNTIYSLTQLTDTQISLVIEVMNEFALDTSWEYDYVDSEVNDISFSCEPYAIVTRTVNQAGIKRTEFVCISKKTLTIADSGIYDMVYYGYNKLAYIKIKDDGELEYTKQQGYLGHSLAEAGIYSGGMSFGYTVSGFTDPIECVNYQDSRVCYTEQWNYINGEAITSENVVTVSEP